MIPGYLKGELKPKEFEEFARHIRSCKDCYEEFETLYIIDLTTRILEEDQDHNFSEDIKTHLFRELADKEKKIRRNRIKGRLFHLLYLLLFLIAVILVLHVIGVLDLPFL